MIHIVKRRGHKQEFDERKVYASVYAACIVCGASEEESESTANLVSKQINNWIENKEEVSSEQIFKKVIDELKHLNKEAAYMYSTHREIS